jgi:SAM-dependent methyltransferase
MTHASGSTKLAVRLSSPFKAFYRATLFQKFYCIALLYFAYLLMTNYGRPDLSIEGFKQSSSGEQKKFVVRQTVPQIYDQFYANVYDQLLFSKIKNDLEVGEIIANTNPTKASKILDIGSGCGHHVSAFIAEGYKTTQGIDLSADMVKLAQATYPDADFTEADALDGMLFPANSFTHILCLYFTIYYIPDKITFFQNCMQWLVPGGFLALHLVNPDKFDPIIPAGDPFKVVSPQNYVEKRIMDTVVKFTDMEYKAKFEMKPNGGNGTKNVNAVLKETFKPKTPGKPVLQNEHQLYMPSESEVLILAKTVGFIIEGKSDLTRAQYSDQYIYYLRKPS